MTAVRTVLALSFLFMAAPLQAQITGGSQSTIPTTRVEEREEEPQVERVFEGRRMTRFGTASPSGDYGRMPTQTGYVYFNSDAIEPVFSRGVGATGGWFLEGNRRAYPELDFVPVEIPGGLLGLGYEYAFGFSYMNIDWATIYNWDDMEISLGEFLMDARIGPVVSYSPLPGLFISTAFKLGLGMGLGSYTEIWDYPLASGRSVDITDSMSPAMGLARSFGFDVQYSRLSVGWEINSTAVDRTRTHSLIFDDGQVVDFEYNVPVPISTSRFYLGFSF